MIGPNLTNSRALKRLRGFLTKVSKFTKVLPIYQKQLDLAQLLILFGRARSSISVGDDDQIETVSTTRVDHLVTYVVSHYKHVSCFQDLKPYLEELSSNELKELINRLSDEGAKVRSLGFTSLLLNN
jgi:hypothetical protein